MRMRDTVARYTKEIIGANSTNTAPLNINFVTDGSKNEVKSMNLEEIILITMLKKEVISPDEISTEIGLPIPLVEEVLEKLKLKGLLEDFDV